jgi:hypothetical protein
MGGPSRGNLQHRCLLSVARTIEWRGRIDVIAVSPRKSHISETATSIGTKPLGAYSSAIWLTVSTRTSASDGTIIW